MIGAIALALALASPGQSAPAAPPAGTPAPAATPAPAPAAAPAPPYGAPIALADAQRLLDRALAAARAKGFRMAVAIVEPDGNLVAFARMDDTQYGSIVVAQGKAATAARFRRTTAVFAQGLTNGPGALSLPGVIAVAGGRPIVTNGRIIGAIGVSGGTSAQDDVIAAEALGETP